MCETVQQTKNCINLQGSAAIICEYLNYGINSILFQRGIYPPESFKTVQHFGLTILMSEDEKIKAYLSTILPQIQEWLSNQQVDQVSMIIKNVRSNEVLECWDFKVQHEPGDGFSNDELKQPTTTKELKRIQNEIRDVMRQISATISYLPLLDCICSFDILITIKKGCDVPEKWDETAPVFIHNSQDVQLRSFSTGLHKLDTIVHYKMDI